MSPPPLPSPSMGRSKDALILSLISCWAANLDSKYTTEGKQLVHEHCATVYSRLHNRQNILNGYAAEPTYQPYIYSGEGRGENKSVINGFSLLLALLLVC